MEQVQEDSVGGDSGEGDPNGRAVESKDENLEASKQYWEVKWKKEGVWKPKKKSHATCDIQLIFKKDVCNIKGNPVVGEYCQLCLENGTARKNAFFTGNVSSHHTHITRFHYYEYVSRCKAKQIEPKAHPPEASGKNKGQKTMDGYIVAVKKVDTIPLVTKAGLKEFLLELIVDGDLICPIFLFTCMAYFLIYSYKSFQFIEQPSFQHLVYYLNLKVKDTDIPKQTCMSDAIMHKVECLDDIDTTLVENISSLVSIVWDGWSSKCHCPFSSYSIQYINSSPNDPYNWSLKSHLITFN
ncbi:hypothetical protein AX15_007067 [Amanita polypyramis BW_CC]|nr:hypothetical protein AX15_007067 [Amanita polypyramis BW_CC]